MAVRQERIQSLVYDIGDNEGDDCRVFTGEKLINFLAISCFFGFSI
jgi:hypothetical protein